MPIQSFDCPNCGAPLDAPATHETTMRCPYCSTSVMIPAEIRKAPQPGAAVFTVSSSPVQRQPAQSKRGCGWLLVVLVAVILFAGVMIALPLLAIPAVTGQVVSQVDSVIVKIDTAQTALAPTKTPAPRATVTPTPGALMESLRFGEKGIGAGMMEDARYIVVDGKSSVYVADYSGGRIQAFDDTGAYLRQWKVGGEDSTVQGLAAGGDGSVYVATGGVIKKYDGAAGTPSGQYAHPEGGEFGSLAVTPDGSLAAVWYQARWGVITSLEGHREDLVVFAPDGKMTTVARGFVSAQTRRPELDTTIAIDGEGSVYALSSTSRAVFKFGADGTYVDRFEPSTSQGDVLDRSIAVDGQGRIYAAGFQGIGIFSPEGQLLAVYPARGALDSMAFDLGNNLWVVARDHVLRYSLNLR